MAYNSNDIPKPMAQPEQEPKCNPHPKAPHGFNRNASHANDRYTCECESWDAYEAGRLDGIAQEQAMYEVQRLGQEIQPEQEPVAWRYGALLYWDKLDALEFMRTSNDGYQLEPLYTTPPQRKPWVSLTPAMKMVFAIGLSEIDRLQVIDDIETKLRELNEVKE